MDKIDRETRSRNMAAIKSTDTKPELTVRRLLYAMGYRYRLHRNDIPGKPDIAFIGRRKVIQIHGCFWHQHPGCNIAHVPKSRQAYWGPKLAKNVSRDKINLIALAAAGWDVLILWECEIKQDNLLKERIVEFLGPQKAGAPQRRRDQTGKSRA